MSGRALWTRFAASDDPIPKIQGPLQTITEEHLAAIRKTIEEHRFVVNEEKVRFYGKEDVKQKKTKTNLCPKNDDSTEKADSVVLREEQILCRRRGQYWRDRERNTKEQRDQDEVWVSSAW